MAGPLPFELCDLVIDELRFSFTDLKVCSLVCKAFLPRCRAHLYRILHIGPRRICGIDKERMQSLFEELQNSFTETLQQPDIVSCIQGLCIESRIRDVFYNPPRVVNPSQPQGKAVIKPSISSIDLPFKQLQFLRTHWKFIDSLNDPSDSVSGDVALFEQVLDRIDCLEHLVIEKYWRFHAYRDILRSIAVHAPHLKTLCLSEFRWYPSFSILVLEDIFDEWSSKFASLGITPLRLDRLCLRNFSTKGTDLIQMVVLPSPCLDLRMLRYLAMPASSLEKAFTDERFSELGRELIHLTITDLNTSGMWL
ncbi:hypothetical protein GYMLUDRAFT_758556 [Collybiopsis luxurians FD-317 M1]|uniref:F-box domain-containing protein n=1 Tax=Collybiopsis luxurians FD-317 M1 TaxID=944289 RepID=A0A0D0CGU6_9AGAR|nr:hypothetical protein GYMLUDRAFT_758556 [Collybiopsis luxurians FD-317 M1]